MSQIEAAPEDCLVRTILTRWYAGRRCALCSVSLGEIEWIHHRPAVMNPNRLTLEWSEIIP